MRGNRTLNHAIHMAAVTQIRFNTPGRVYYDRKIAEGKTKKGSPPSLETSQSPTPSTAKLVTDAVNGPPDRARGAPRNVSVACVAGPRILITGSSAQPPQATPNATPSRLTRPPRRARNPALDTKRHRYGRMCDVLVGAHTG